MKLTFSQWQGQCKIQACCGIRKIPHSNANTHWGPQHGVCLPGACLPIRKKAYVIAFGSSRQDLSPQILEYL